MKNTIAQEIDRQVALEPIAGEQSKGAIGRMVTRYDVQNSDRLLGLLLKFDFAASHIVTCDPWKRCCGGVLRGAFVVFRIDPRAVDPEDALYSDRLILARVVDEAPTPVDAQTQHDRAALIQPEVMQAPAVWLASDGSNAINGRRVIAYHWDERLPLAERLAKASAPAAWPQLGRQSISLQR